MKRFSRSPLDLSFRELVAEKLRSAKRKVDVVTGEFSAFSNYLELQWAVREAALRGVKFRIYANSLKPGITRKLLDWGCNVYTGLKRSDNHFMIVDGREAVISEKHTPDSIGERHGMVTKREIARFTKSFQNLVRAGKRVKTVRAPDPLIAFISGPPLAIIKDAHMQIDDSAVQVRNDG